jgi:hypothetical protein
VLASTLAHLTEKKLDDEEEEDDTDGQPKRKKSQLYGGDLEAGVAVLKAVANRLRYLLQTQSDSFYNKESYVQEVFQVRFLYLEVFIRSIYGPNFLQKPADKKLFDKHEVD